MPTIGLIYLLYFLRMLGLFCILPVFAIAAVEELGATAWQIGLAVGVYGIAQCLLQIPLGWASDRYGRRRVILMALLVFAGGSVIAALSDTVLGVIAGRFMQGSAAIAGVLLAWIGDVVVPERRSVAMAGVGGSIALAFGLSMVVGPWLYSTLGLSSLFWFCGGLALVAAVLVLALDDRQNQSAQIHGHIDEGPWLTPDHRASLTFICVGIALNHFVLMAVFLMLPQALVQAGMAVGDHGLFYLVVLVLSLVFIAWPLAKDRRGGSMSSAVWPFPLMAIAMILLTTEPTLGLLVLASVLLFMGFNFLEASYPSRATLLASASRRGLVMGIYSTCQFAGIALGGAAGGFIVSVLGDAALLIVCATVLALFTVVERAVLRSGFKADVSG
jgi:MFS family permease